MFCQVESDAKYELLCVYTHDHDDDDEDDDDDCDCDDLL